MKIPKAITETLEDYYEVKYLGKYQGYDAYSAYIPNAYTGFPIVYLMDGEKIEKELNAFDALDIINEILK